MVAHDIWGAFSKMFPDWAQEAESYKKVGSKTISIKMKNSNKHLIFLYNDPTNWSFGTKAWRQKPDNLKKEK